MGSDTLYKVRRRSDFSALVTLRRTVHFSGGHRGSRRPLDRLSRRGQADSRNPHVDSSVGGCAVGVTPSMRNGLDDTVGYGIWRSRVRRNRGLQFHPAARVHCNGSFAVPAAGMAKDSTMVCHGGEEQQNARLSQVGQLVFLRQLRLCAERQGCTSTGRQPRLSQKDKA